MTDELKSVPNPRQARAAVLENAKRAGLNPGTIIDVGFAIGTPGLFGVFEDAQIMLIEPIAEMEPAMQAFCREHPKARYVVAAASDENGEKTFMARRSVGVSSFHAGLKTGDAEARQVRTVTLDTLVRDYDLPGPFLIKMDVEGHELHVLRGAVETLKATDLVILEVGVWNDNRKRGSASMMDLYRFMEEQGFSFYDYIEPHYRPLDGALAGFDGAWARTDGVLRQNRSYRTPEESAAKREARIKNSAAYFGADKA